MNSSAKTPSQKRRAFTLVEVILAILIISAIMTVLLYFYQRSAEVRQTVIQEVEFLSVSRMFMEQISSELRSARPVEDQFIGLEGNSNSISFVCTSIPQMARWIVSSNEPITLPPSTDLKRVSYSMLLGGTNALAARGLDRSEELLLGGQTLSSNALESPVSTNLADLRPSVTGTNISTNELQATRLPLTDRIRFLQFRYWEGTNWVDTWNRLELPSGVEITVGREPMPAETAAPVSSSDDSNGSPEQPYPYEVFRRVVYLPNSKSPGNQAEKAASTNELVL
jgi:prepilin-type N-terminal cleavage/methylation domain-containing protein